ncbi:hypothetical protein AB1Y20_011553 [Prymnesium parvum]|uniref:HNH endonuclease n=1 Tax=Prymnesium parvum TaxID=97485 RepID=A0AB34IK42_PRYPA
MSFVLRDLDSDEELDQRQNAHKFPWEVGNARSEWFEAGAGTTWEKKGYRDNPEKFRKDVRRTIVNQRADGRTREDLYGNKSDVGHIFADTNGGSNTIGNVYMQPAGMNRAMRGDYDEINAAFVGHPRTEKAMKESREYGNLGGGRWDQWTSEAVVDHGKEKLKKVGVLTKKGGELDKRCAAYKNKQVGVDADGHVWGMETKIQELRLIEKTLPKKTDDLAEYFSTMGLGGRK